MKFNFNFDVASSNQKFFLPMSKLAILGCWNAPLLPKLIFKFIVLWNARISGKKIINFKMLKSKWCTSIFQKFSNLKILQQVSPQIGDQRQKNTVSIWKRRQRSISLREYLLFEARFQEPFQSKSINKRGSSFPFTSKGNGTESDRFCFLYTLYPLKIKLKSVIL